MNDDYETSLNEYFKLKNTYDNKLIKQKMQIFNNKKLSYKQKKEYLQELKINCISCKRRVGTIFEYKDNKYKAVCGDTQKPCNLNIIIEKAKYINVKDEISKTIELINDLKNIIIKTKLSLIFGFITTDEIEDIFEDIQLNLKENIQILDIYNQVLLSNTDIENRNNNLKELRIELYETIKIIKENISEYIKTNNQQYLIEVIQIYSDDFKNILHNIKNNKYRSEFTEKEFVDNKIKINLVQNINNYSDYELEREEGKVIKFII